MNAIFPPKQIGQNAFLHRESECKSCNLSMLQVAKTSKLGQKCIIHDFSLRALTYEPTGSLWRDANTASITIPGLPAAEIIRVYSWLSVFLG